RLLGFSRFPYTTLFRSRGQARTLPEFAEKKAVCKGNRRRRGKDSFLKNRELALSQVRALRSRALTAASFFSDLVQRLRRKILGRSEEHTSELQSRENLV